MRSRVLVLVVAALALAALLSPTLALQPHAADPAAAPLEPVAAAADAQFDSASLLELRTSTGAWTCCRVCPQHHLLEMDQMLGATPPSANYDDEAPKSRTFLHLQAKARLAHEASGVTEGNQLGEEGNCCNVCPIGLAAAAPAALDSAPAAAAAAGVRPPKGYKAPLDNLLFNLRRTPLPPCCPYCRLQASMDEPFSSVVRQEKMRSLPARRGASLLETASGARVDRAYTFTPATPDSCCNRCLRPPTLLEHNVRAGEDMWPAADPASVVQPTERVLPSPEQLLAADQAVHAADAALRQAKAAPVVVEGVTPPAKKAEAEEAAEAEADED